MVFAYIGLGANLGQAQATLRQAADALARTPDVQSLELSPFYRSAPIDSSGPDYTNLKIGEQRAEVVRRYLAMQHGFALHRMNAISYGETAPIADNKTRAGRAENRRVTLVVLQ